MGVTIRAPDFRTLSWLWLPLLLALLARVAVAPGWMMEMDSGGTFTVRICSDVNSVGKTVEIPFERSGYQIADQQHCPWGVLAVGGPPVDGPGAAQSPVAVNRALIAAPRRGFAPDAAAPLPPSTGPPRRA